MKNEYAQWRKLDNAALAFPAVTGKNDTRVFRFYCELKEEIKEENLQEALERTLEKYPLFRACFKERDCSGFIWRDVIFRQWQRKKQVHPAADFIFRTKKRFFFG